MLFETWQLSLHVQCETRRRMARDVRVIFEADNGRRERCVIADGPAIIAKLDEAFLKKRTFDDADYNVQ